MQTPSRSHSPLYSKNKNNIHHFKTPLPKTNNPSAVIANSKKKIPITPTHRRFTRKIPVFPRHCMENVFWRTICLHVNFYNRRTRNEKTIHLHVRCIIHGSGGASFRFGPFGVSKLTGGKLPVFGFGRNRRRIGCVAVCRR